VPQRLFQNPTTPLNVARIHKTLRVTPAMAAGLSDHVWSLEEIVLLKQVKLDGAWKRYPVVINRNGSIKPDHVLVAGKPTHAPDGNYILDWYEDGKRVCQSVGKDAADALIQRDRMVAELEAASNGLVVLRRTSFCRTRGNIGEPSCTRRVSSKTCVP
jgi:hypothetical protein